MKRLNSLSLQKRIQRLPRSLRNKYLNLLQRRFKKEVEVIGELPAQSPQPMEIDEASKPSSQEKFPETAQVSELPIVEVIDLLDI